jgi:hypothetical protein
MYTFPTLGFSPSMNTGLLGSTDSSRDNSAESNRFCDGCAANPPPRNSQPRTEPLCLARPSKSTTWRPRALRACSSFVLAVPVGPDRTTARRGGGAEREATTLLRYSLSGHKSRGCAEPIAAGQDRNRKPDRAEDVGECGAAVAAAPAVGENVAVAGEGGRYGAEVL